MMFDRETNVRIVLAVIYVCITVLILVKIGANQFTESVKLASNTIVLQKRCTDAGGITITVTEGSICISNAMLIKVDK